MSSAPVVPYASSNNQSHHMQPNEATKNEENFDYAAVHTLIGVSDTFHSNWQRCTTSIL